MRKISAFRFLLSVFKSRRFRWTVRVLVLAVILSGVAVVLLPQKVLTVDSGPARADVIIVLGGAPHDRAPRAAELFEEGAAPRIICSGTGDDRRNQQLLMQAGVPANAIELESNSFTTRENALYTIPLLHALGARRVIIVTSWFHSRRALHTFRHYAPDITFYSRPSYYGYPGDIPSSVRRPLSSDFRPLHSNVLSASIGERNEGEVSTSASQNVSVSASKNPTADLRPLASDADHRSVAWLSRKEDWREVKNYVKTEYTKLIGYWFYYGICPL